MSADVTDAVSLKGLTKTFKLQWRRGSVLALEDLDLSVPKGEIYGLLGPNGSGKSTTMKLILGLIGPTRGSAEIFGYPAGTMDARNLLGFLPENPYFPNFLSGREVLNYYGKLSGLSGKHLKTRAEELLDLVGLTMSGDRPLRTYSKGMLQRIGLAQALLHDPELLLLDEPTAGVDPVGSRQMRDLILKLKNEGKTVIFSSHLLEQVQEVADRVGILHLGQKLQEGTLDELLSVEEDLQVTFSKLPTERQKKLEELLEKEGFCEVKFSRPQIRLEEFFINQLPSKGEGARERRSKS